jgi:hypothetical protein
MKKQILVVLYPYKFSKFLWNSMELDYISRYFDIEVWDLSLVLNRKFANSIYSYGEVGEEVIRFSGIVQLTKYLFKFRKKNSKKRIYYINEIPLATFKNVICYTLVLGSVSGNQILEYLNPGVPPNYLNDLNNPLRDKKSIYRKFIDVIIKSSGLKEFLQIVNSRVATKFGNVIAKSGTHKLIAGHEWLRESKNFNLRKNIKVILGHSNDISNCIIYSRVKVNSKNSRIVHLDAAGPFFGTDSIILKRKTFLTSENWYPKLSNFFSYLEVFFAENVTIAGHYKSNFSSPSPVFQGREVIYMNTIALVANAKLVTTRFSSAISIAVFFKKPIYFIYSNELLLDKESMRHITGLSALLKSPSINIDNIQSVELNSFKVDDLSYSDFITKYLSSGPKELANYEIILRNFLV